MVEVRCGKFEIEQLGMGFDYGWIDVAWWGEAVVITQPATAAPLGKLC